VAGCGSTTTWSGGGGECETSGGGERIGVVDPLPTAASRLALSARWLMAFF
jgi:hypothetical protein